MRISNHHKLIGSFLLICFVSVFFSADVFSDDPMADLTKERNLLPPPVFDLFYAIKNSLDYGVIGEELQPLPDYKDYSRVTKSLLDKLHVEWEVINYSASADDYEIIVQKKGDPSSRYKGTRMEKFKWEDEVWVSLGGYLYI